MKYGIVINTYYRTDGTTKQYLTRALNSIKQQTYDDYLVFLIGDHYTDEKEFYEYLSLMPADKIVAINLPYAKEREIYFNNNEKLWCSGGVNARNIGINIAIMSGISFVLNLDHDDYWQNNHLESINKVLSEYPDAVFVCTKSTHGRGGDMLLPNISPNTMISEIYPIPNYIVNSSTCVNFKKVGLRYTDVFEKFGRVEPSDAFLWKELKDYMIENNLKGYLYNSTTCYHEEERRSTVSNKLNITQKSLNILKNISDNMSGNTFHHHYHILYDIRNNFDCAVTYVEIGAYAGGSACLMLSHPSKTKALSIDISNPIPKEIVLLNTQKFKNETNDFTYIQGDSSSQETLNYLLKKLNGESIDILFIDGDHSYSAVINDFEIYSKYLSHGGYLIFDDYLDSVHSPDVKFAVDDILKNKLSDDFYIIGSLENIYGARPNDLKMNNCFVIQKKPNVLVEYVDDTPRVYLTSKTNETYEVVFFGIDSDNKHHLVYRAEIKNEMWCFPYNNSFKNWKINLDGKVIHQTVF